VKAARLILPLAVLLSRFPAASLRAQEGETLDINAVLHSPPSYWDSLLQAGPIFQALHLLLAASFIVALILPSRRTPWSWSLALAFGPFVLGGLATWIFAQGLAVRGSWAYHSDLYSEMAAVPRPIQLGIVLTTFALAYRIICHVASRKERNSESTAFTAPALTGRLGAVLPYWPIVIFGAGVLLSQAPFLFDTVSAMMPRRPSMPVSPVFDPESFAEGLGGVGVVILVSGAIAACLECVVRAAARLIRSRK
jgi:hypothetical protein